MGCIWANLGFELSQVWESCFVWNQAGKRIESRQRQQQVAEKQLQLFFYWSSCNFGRDFRQNQFHCHQNFVQTIFMKELLHPSTTNIIQIQSISPSTRHGAEPFIVRVNNHLQKALYLKKLFWPWSKTSLLVLYLWSLKMCPCCTSAPGLKVYSFHFWSLLKWSHCTSPHLQACVSLLIILEAPWKRSLEGFIDSPTANSKKVFCNRRIDRSI